MGAYIAWALAHRDQVEALVTVDARLPGAQLGDSRATNPAPGTSDSTATSSSPACSSVAASVTAGTFVSTLEAVAV
jgi:pimeloyl-ACP methyl ester carboxylesterase